TDGSVLNPQKEKERLSEHKRQVHTLVNKSKGIIRLKPRNPEEKSNSPVIVEALCDFKQDQDRQTRTLILYSYTHTPTRTLTHTCMHTHTHSHVFPPPVLIVTVTVILFIFILLFIF